MKPRLCLDLDGVFADLEKFLSNFHGEDYKNMEPSFVWRPFDCTCKNLFRDLDVIPGSLEFLEYIKSFDYDIMFLTGLPYPNGYLITARDDKEHWVRNVLKSNLPIYYVYGGINKRIFVDNSNDILIDDTPRNIEQWEVYGGTGILHKTFDKTKEMLYNLSHTN